MTIETRASAPLLRSPPFPGVDANIARATTEIARPFRSSEDIDRLFAAIRGARVGGDFWFPPAPRSSAAVIIRARSTSEMERACAKLDEAERASAFWLRPTAGGIDPWSLLDGKRRLVAHGDDEWVALAHVAGCPVECLSDGRFGAPGADGAALRARTAQALSMDYRNPFTGNDATIEETINQLADWRQALDANRGIVAACGMAWWKRREIARFLWSPACTLRFFRSERRAIAYAARQNGSVAVWPPRVSARLADRARAKGVPLIRIEDGFVRSVGLGSNLVPPSSITIDRQGIHYDPGKPSDLESLLAHGDFSAPLLARAQALRHAIRSAGIGKYGGAGSQAVPPRKPERRLVLVPGQVEDDMSVRLGGGGLSSNLELLRRTRALEPDAEIWFRPHPDVDAGHRKGAIGDAEALVHADRVVRGGGMARLLEVVDGVHVLTSLTGFEAIVRDCEVTCHGTPFYAGWGLTRDLAPVSERRGRQLTPEQLIAAVLIVYPRYLDPVTQVPCPPEILIQRITDGAARNRLSWITPFRQRLGELTRSQQR